jgi:hypothetical protein
MFTIQGDTFISRCISGVIFGILVGLVSGLVFWLFTWNLQAAYSRGMLAVVAFLLGFVAAVTGIFCLIALIASMLGGLHG